MRTDDLIQALALDLPPARPLPRRLLLALAPAAVVVAVAVGLWLGYRPDLGEALRGPSFWIRAGYAAAVAGVGFWLLNRAGRPGADVRGGLILLALIVAGEGAWGLNALLAMPVADRATAVMGSGAPLCLSNIVILSLLAAPFVFVAARVFAPTRPRLAGAAGGLLAAGLAATLYGAHCLEEAPAFVAVWYTAGMAVAAAVGALVGKRVFRW